jgi:hypothetical protein
VDFAASSQVPKQSQIVAKSTMGLIYDWAKLYLEFVSVLNPTVTFLLQCFKTFPKLRLLSLNVLCEISLYLKAQFTA